MHIFLKEKFLYENDPQKLQNLKKMLRKSLGLKYKYLSCNFLKCGFFLELFKSCKNE